MDGIVADNQHVIVKNKPKGECARIGKEGCDKDRGRQKATHSPGVARQIALPFELRWSLLRLHD